jgi:hypothetical protein
MHVDRCERTRLRNAFERIASMPGDTVPRERLAALMIAASLAIHQYDQERRFDEETHARCLRDRGGLSDYEAAKVTLGIYAALYPTYAKMCLAKKEKYGLRAKIRNLLFDLAVLCGARTSPAAESYRSRC